MPFIVAHGSTAFRVALAADMSDVFPDLDPVRILGWPVFDKDVRISSISKGRL
jgi:hypothetical protein